MFPIETAPQLFHDDRRNTFRNVTTAAEALSTFNRWNSSEILESKDVILKAETFKKYA